LPGTSRGLQPTALPKHADDPDDRADDYTVFFGDDKFTVTEPNDMRFLDYFLKRVMALDEMPGLGRRDGLIRRIFRWMAQPLGAP
jgi:hypothetical protein